MKHLLPPIWLLAVIAGLPQISETIYTPSLPDIARSLAVPDALVEYTLTIYLAGFAVGTLFWGKLSDKFGRKPCLLIGLFIFVLGCIGCYFSDSINLLLISRFIQAFGGSTGSVLGQAIARDAFRGVERGKVYSTISGALSFSPAVGPFVGGVVDQTFGWSSIFLLLMMAGILVFLSVILKLPETHLNRITMHSIKEIAFGLLKDKRVLGYAIVVAAVNGIAFSYYAEGPFYLIDMLGLTPSVYGLTFVGIAFMYFFGAWLSRRLHDHLTSKAILWRGVLVLVGGASFFVVATIVCGVISAPHSLSIVITIGSMSIIAAGSSMVIPNCLSLALEEYQHAVGTASSLFGFFYYALISLFTLIMGFLHNGTLYPMPLYFFALVVLIWVVFLKMIGREEKEESLKMTSKLQVMCQICAPHTRMLGFLFLLTSE